MPIPPNDSNSSSENNNRAPSQHAFRAPWVLILPLALAAGVLVQQSQNTTTYNATSNSIQNTTKPARDDKLRGKPAKYALFVPDDQGDLRREVVIDNAWRVGADEISENSKDVRAQAATRAVKMLMQRHAADFPKGAQMVEDIGIDENDRTVLNFNSAFTNSAFWQGSTRTLASIYALVNTAIESQKTVAGQSGRGEVIFLIEGRPVSALGELDTSEPLATDLKMIAKTVTR